MTIDVDIHGERFTVEEFTLWPFWERIAAFEPQTFDVLDRYLRSDKDFLDIGAWIGPVTLYASRKSRQVIAVEPDRVARHHLETNLLLNGIDNVTVLSCAVAAVAGCYWFGTSTELGDSMSSLVGPDDGALYEVTAMTLPDLGAMDGFDWSLIKIDIEGGEAAVLPASESWIANNSAYPIWLSTHAPRLSDSEKADLSAALWQYGITLSDEYTEVLIHP